MRQRCMETILATPLSLTSILLGKSLAIFILSYIPSLFCVIIVFLQANWPLGLATLILPSSPGWILFFISPVLLFGTICINTLLLMYLNHSMGSLIVNFSVYSSHYFVQCSFFFWHKSRRFGRLYYGFIMCFFLYRISA